MDRLTRDTAATGRARFRRLASPGLLFRLAAWRPPAALGSGRLAVQMSGAGLAHLFYRGDDGIDRARCLSRQRWALSLVTASGASRATLREVRCLAAGDPACEYLVSWQGRASALSVIGTGLVIAALLASTGFPGGTAVAFVVVAVASATTYAVERWRAARTDAPARAQSGAAFGRWVVGTCAPPAEPAPTADAAAVAMDLDGDVWRVGYRNTTIQLRHSRGLALLAHLVRNPGQETHVTTLDAITPSNRPGATRGPADALAAPRLGDAGEILDAKARAEYRRRATELREQIEDADARNDVRRGAAMRDELEQLEDELRLAVGAGGRPRRAANDAERLRVAITHRIRAAIDQIARRHPELGDHLRASVSTGYRCLYQPSSAAVVEDRPRQPDRSA